MKILVTGAGGFIGSHLCEMLAIDGHEVQAMVHYNSRGHRGWLEGSPLKDHIEVVAGDIRDFDSVSGFIWTGAEIDAVVHLAALVGIPFSYESPGAYVKTNAEGTYNVLQSARWCNRKQPRVLIASTSEVFGVARAESMNEDHPRTARSPYAASKIAAEEFGLSYRASFEMSVTVMRPFNTYGPRQSMRAVIPTIIGQILDGQREVKLGTVSPRRDFNYVIDTCRAIMTILKADDPPPVVNIGTGRTRPIMEIARSIMNLIGPEGGTIGVGHERKRPKSSEVHSLCCDPTLIKSMGWEPETSFEDGINKTIDWMRENKVARPGEYHV